MPLHISDKAINTQKIEDMNMNDKEKKCHSRVLHQLQPFGFQTVIHWGSDHKLILNILNAKTMKNLKRIAYSIILIATYFIEIKAQSLKPIQKFNTEYMESYPSLTPDGKMIVFTSLRCGQPWSRNYSWIYNNKSQCDGDIYYSIRTDEGWDEPTVLGPSINTSWREDEPSIFLNGNYIIFESWRADWQESNGPYFLSELSGTDWSTPVGLSDSINIFFNSRFESSSYRMQQDLITRFGRKKGIKLFQLHEKDYQKFQLAATLNLFSDQTYRHFTEGISVSNNGKVLVFSAQDFNAPEINFDLYICYMLSNGEWTYPKMLPINTMGNELLPFIAADEKTLYFSSNRRGGNGGYDIYKADISKIDGYMKSTNIGLPYNSSENDLGFITAVVGDLGYLVRNGDIYEVELNDISKPQEVVLIKGTVKHYKGHTLPGNIALIDQESDEVVATIKNNELTGGYLLVCPRESKSYSLRVNLEDSTTFNYDIEISESSPPVIYVNTVVRFIPFIGQEVSHSTVFYEPEESHLPLESANLLDQIVYRLHGDPNLRVEVSGHTNGIPDAKHCYDLSVERAKKIHDYFVSQGINSDRIQYRGFGKSKPRAPNTSYRSRMKNQRADISIISLKPNM